MKPIPSLYLQPFAITAAGAQQLEAAHAQAMKAVDCADSTIESNPLLQVVGDVAIVTISGPLLRSDNFYSWWFGWATYDGIWQALEEAEANKNVRGILLRINSPGGITEGLGELADYVAALATRIEVWAYVDGMCASAAYWIGSQVNRIVAYETTESGCIGTRAMLVDYTGMYEKAGVAVHDQVSTQSPAKRDLPVDDEVLAKLQARLDDNCELFIAAVCRGRKSDRATVIKHFGKGALLIASKALAVGMIDESGNLQDTIAALSSAAAKRTTSTARPMRAQGAAMNPAMRPGASAGVAAAAAAAEDDDDAKRCAGCGEPMHADAAAYCKHCFEGAGDDDDEDEDEDDEDNKALAKVGLLGKTRGETRKKLAAFVSSVVEATGKETASGAIVAVLDGAKAAADLATFRAESEKQAGAARVKAVVDKLTIAIGTGKVQLGAAMKEIALLSGAPKAAIRTSLAAVEKQEAQPIIAAIVSAGVSVEFAASVDEWLESKGASALPTAHRSASDHDPSAIRASSPPPIGADGAPVGTPLSIDAVQKAAEAAANKGAR